VAGWYHRVLNLTPFPARGTVSKGRVIATPRSAAKLPTFDAALARREDVQRLQTLQASAGSPFQVASRFNLLEMRSPNLTPETWCRSL
jgi:hypothetical protein